MKRRAARFSFVGIGGALLLILTLALGEAAISGALAERRAIRESTSRQALADAETLSHSLDGYIRIAENILATADLRLVSISASSTRAALKEAVYRMPEAANAYLLDAKGSIVAAAWQDRVAAPTIARERLDRLAMAGGSEALVAEGPRGPVLAVVRSLEGPTRARFAAMVFDSVFFDARLTLARSAENSVTVITDAKGRRLVEGAPALLDENKVSARAGDFVSAETSLPTHPLKVLVVHDLRPDLLAWHSRLVSLLAILAVLVVALAVVSAMGAREARRAREALALQEELEARDRLFHEVNHRVKNNLATVQAILHLGEAEIDDDPGRAAEIIKSAAERIDSIGKLHEHLYSRRSIAEIDIGAYFEELAASLKESYGVGEKVSLVVRAERGIPAGLDTGVPIALIVTELVTNSYKYAFPGERSGTILIELRRGEEGGYTIVVSDDGIGMEIEKKTRGFGRSLVEGLARQIGASLRLLPGGPEARGTTWRLEVPTGL